VDQQVEQPLTRGGKQSANGNLVESRPWQRHFRRHLQPKRTTVTGEANASAIIVARIIGPVANRIFRWIISCVANRVALQRRR
jgi:hypothetical protein